MMKENWSLCGHCPIESTGFGKLPKNQNGDVQSEPRKVSSVPSHMHTVYMCFDFLDSLSDVKIT